MSEVVPFPTPEEAEETLSRLADLRRAHIPIPRSAQFRRSDVVSAFTAAFELIGGTTRLALWANENPTEFYRLFGKLLPSATQTEIMSRGADGDLRHIATHELELLLVQNQDGTYEAA